MEDFFRNPKKSSFNISPDGLCIAYMKPWEQGNRMMNIYVKSIIKEGLKGWRQDIILLIINILYLHIKFY